MTYDTFDIPLILNYYHCIEGNFSVFFREGSVHWKLCTVLTSGVRMNRGRRIYWSLHLLVPEQGPAGSRHGEVDTAEEAHGHHHGPGEQRLVLHVRLDGGESRGPSKGEHDRTEGFAKSKDWFWCRVVGRPGGVVFVVTTLLVRHIHTFLSRSTLRTDRVMLASASQLHYPKHLVST